ncbi:YcjX family protein [Alphaproteobacteria bacterium GH1-50]|uniref:YcjX family protein n=1 Tax=Kangsaoukella pontilimi TaxID=2691042 RepID=A0A7C9IIF9_9RHOB|nr:YcjX family protein [Kangsaoukella pontilimi]MXQ09329.1 YcjX family protein [Kangsaoukella pontilimi]
MVLGTIADGLTRGVETTVNTVSEAFFEPVIRLGVTGLSRAGKTVFITSLVANLVQRGRMPALRAAADGRLLSAWLQPQPDDTVPRFPYEDHLARITGPEPTWPEGTTGISELRLSLRVKPDGLLGGLSGPRTIHLDIVDYPGEWLLDLALLDVDFETWSKSVLEKIANRDQAAPFRALLEQTDPTAKLDEPTAQRLAEAFTGYLTEAREAGYSDCTPGRFLLPGDLRGSPVLTFAPLPPSDAGRGTLAREFARRFDAYKREVVRPFFRDHFSRIDRQIVLVDVLGAIHAGPKAVEDLRIALSDILAAFRPGKNAFLSQIFLGKRVEKILFAATKADHLHNSQHASLTAIADALLTDARARADFAGAETRAMSIAALRSTTEDRISRDGRELDVVRGRLLDGGRHAAFYPGRLPEDPARLLTPARQGAEAWLDADYGVMTFAPEPLTLKPGDGPPHIRLDRAAEFLIGDRLR